jgi:hypothetical protein
LPVESLDVGVQQRAIGFVLNAYAGSEAAVIWQADLFA